MNIKMGKFNLLKKLVLCVVFSAALTLFGQAEKKYALAASEKQLTFDKPYKNVSDVFYFGKGDNPLRTIFVVPKVSVKKGDSYVKSSALVSRIIDTSENVIVAVFEENGNSFADVYIPQDSANFTLVATLRGGEALNKDSSANSKKASADKKVPAQKKAEQVADTAKDAAEEAPKPAAKKAKQGATKINMRDFFSKNKKSAQKETPKQNSKPANSEEGIDEDYEAEIETEVVCYLSSKMLELNMPLSYCYLLNTGILCAPQQLDPKKVQRKKMGDFTIMEYKNKTESVCKIKVMQTGVPSSVAELNIKPSQYLKYEKEGSAIVISDKENVIIRIGTDEPSYDSSSPFPEQNNFFGGY